MSEDLGSDPPHALKIAKRELTIRARQLDHDLRAPVGAIAGALDLMKYTTNDPFAQAEALRVLERQLARLISLTQEVREFSRAIEA